MITVSIWHHKDGNHLAVFNKPWWTYIIDQVGWYQPRWGWDYWIWSKILDISRRYETDRYQVPITEHPCLVSVKIWPNEKRHLCWYDDCPVTNSES
jgi:hypothetical protein